MTLTTIEQLVLWTPPVVTLFVAVGYYIWWGKESEEDRDTTRNTSVGGES